MKETFETIKQDLEEHLSSINENTSEIQALFDYIGQVEKKIDAIAQRLDGLQLGSTGNERKAILPFDHEERQIFLVLYTQESAMTFDEIAQKSGVARAIVPERISSLVHKGVPLHRSYFNDQLFLQLDSAFKELQAKENIINLSLHSFIDS